jgi:hypothetical protein
MKSTFQASRQQTIDELRHQLRFASTPQDRQAIMTQIDFWRRQA